MHASIVVALLTPRKAEAFFLFAFFIIGLWHFTRHDTSATVASL
jgi:hypothetical protein